MISALIKRFQTISPLRLLIECDDQGLRARVTQGDLFIEPKDWFQVDAPWLADSREQALLWRRLAEFGIKEFASSLLWPHEMLASVTSAELSKVTGSSRFPYLPQLAASHHLMAREFTYQLTFLDSSGRQVPLTIYPAIAQLGERFWVLSEPLRKIVATLGTPRPDATESAERYAELSQLKTLLAQVGGLCDDYLQQQEIHGLDRVQFDLDDDGEELRITPYCPQLPAGLDLETMALQFGKVEAQYSSMGTSGRVVRVLTSPSVREALDSWRGIRRLRGPRRTAFLAKPRAFLTQAAIDWDDLEKQVSLIRESSITLLEETPQAFVRPQAPLLVDLKPTTADIAHAEWVEPSAELVDTAVALPQQAPAAPSMAQIPPSLSENVELLPHQIEGLAWLQSLVDAGEPGGLLADDMGLGKTLQVLCFLEWMRLSQGGTSLVVAPLILLQNWKRECLHFFQGDRCLSGDDIVVLYGEELRSYRNGSGLDLQRLAGKSLIITSLEMLRIYQVDLERVDWSVVVVDEAQNIKSPTAQVTKAANSLRAKFRLAASGTPVENHLGDLWSLLNFAKPGFLGSRKEFLSQFRCETLEEMEQVSLQLQERIESLYLRRTKKDILKELPAKHHHFIPLKMPAGQARAYATTLEQVTQQGKRGLEASWILRKASCWDGLASAAVKEMIASSCKFQWLIELLREIQAKQEKVLIFVDILELQDLLLVAIEHELKVRVEVINGQTSSGPTQSGREAILVLGVTLEGRVAV